MCLIFTFSDCVSLKASWTMMRSTPPLPVPAGTKITLKCRTWYELTGSEQITCIEGGSFGFNGDEPSCKIIECKSGFQLAPMYGKCFSKFRYKVNDLSLNNVQSCTFKYILKCKTYIVKSWSNSREI